MTPVQLVQEVAAQYGREINEKFVDYILWEHTGFPNFVEVPEGQTYEAALRAQIVAYFEEIEGCSHDRA